MRTTMFRGLFTAILMGQTACSASDLVSNTALPPHILDPDAVKTPAGARAAYNGALIAFAGAVGQSGLSSFVGISGLLADELQPSAPLQSPIDINMFPTSSGAAIDNRLIPDNDFSPDAQLRTTDLRGTYTQLQGVRARTREAAGMLRKYAPTFPKDLIGHLYVVEGMAELFLGELFCSGIPLSTLNFEANYTLTRGYSSIEVFQHARALFDSALVYATDSTRIIHFAKIGRARALLALNDYAAAANAVSGIPTTYTYSTSYSTSVSGLLQPQLAIMHQEK